MDYDATYRAGDAPWEIGGPQPALAAVLDTEVRGPKVLDLGCGTGDLAIELARRGYQVTGVDISPVGIALARTKAAAAGVTVDFEVQDATKLALRAGPFDSIFDSGLLHNLHRTSATETGDYLALLPGLAAPDAKVFVLAVSAEAGPGWSLTEDVLRATFAGPLWTGTRVEPVTVAAEIGGGALSLAGFLLRTRLAGRR
jgi:SAM-dependent methyltransferase